MLAGDRDAMVVVGAMHLVGEQGLVQLLRTRGYTVEQVTKTLERSNVAPTHPKEKPQITQMDADGRVGGS